MIYITRYVLLFGIVTLGLIGCRESWTKHFETVEDAKKQGLVDKGWIPKYIPPDASSLAVSGDLDSGIALGSFFSAKSGTVEEHCSIAPDASSIPDYALRWLKEGNVAVDNAAGLRSKGYEVFECAENFNFAYSTSTHRFYYWTAHKK